MDTSVIVALPSADDKVNKISSEKGAHLTIAFLGETANLDLETIVLFVQHAAAQLSPFGLEVDYRGTLGPDNADVLFFKKDGWSFPRISDFRGHLLQNDAISRAYASVEQYPEWTPHLTLGYPATPAHKDESDYPGIHYVQFDRIAVWTGDSVGPEFRLKYEDDGMAVAMSDISTVDRGRSAVDEMFHYGVKGMKWGVTTKDRASQKAPTEVSVTQTKNGTFAKTNGGKNLPLHGDSKESLVVRQKAKSSTTDALSNAELRTAINRMQLEQQYTQLAFASDRRSRGARFISGLFGNPRYNGEKIKFKDADEQSGKQVRDAIDAALKAKRATTGGEQQ